jgi:hypothetical protein
MEQSSFWESQNSLSFMEPDGSVECSQEAATSFCSEPNESSP